MTIDELTKALCKEMVLRVVALHDRSFIVSSFMYPDGDFVSLYLDGGMVSDNGATLRKARTHGVEITERRDRFIKNICHLYGAELGRHGAITKQIGQEPEKTVMSWGQAVTRISNLIYDGGSRRHTSLKHELDELMMNKVNPQRSVTFGWVDPSFDQTKSWAVDYRMNGSLEPRHVFHVLNGNRSNVVAAICMFYRETGITVPSLAVADPEIKFGAADWGRLKHACKRVVEGVSGNENEIVGFALGK